MSSPTILYRRLVVVYHRTAILVLILHFTLDAVTLMLMLMLMLMLTTRTLYFERWVVWIEVGLMNWIGSFNGRTDRFLIIERCHQFTDQSIYFIRQCEHSRFRLRAGMVSLPLLGGNRRQQAFASRHMHLSLQKSIVWRADSCPTSPRTINFLPGGNE